MSLGLDSDLQRWVGELQRTLGEQVATNRALVARLEAIERREEARDEKLGAVYDWMLQARGSWKAMLGAAGFGAACAAMLSNIGTFVSWIRGH